MRQAYDKAIRVADNIQSEHNFEELHQELSSVVAYHLLRELAPRHPLILPFHVRQSVMCYGINLWSRTDAQS